MISIFQELAEQLFIPKPFRFPRQTMKETDALVKKLEVIQQTLKTIPNQLHSPPADGFDTASQENRLIPLLCEIITDVWRARKRMLQRERLELSPEMRRIYRPIEAIFDTLAQEEFEIVDRTNQKYDIGLTEKVLAAEKKPGLEHDIVSEVIKPSIYYQGQLIQRGEIIISTPENG